MEGRIRVGNRPVLQNAINLVNRELVLDEVIGGKNFVISPLQSSVGRVN
jgi:hypothetical protein